MSKQNNPTWNASFIEADMVAGYVLLDRDRPEDACKLWLELWALVKQSAPAGIKNVEDLDKLLSDKFSIHDWVQDLEMELWNSGLKNPEFHHARISFCKEFVEWLSESPPLIVSNMRRVLGETYYEVGNTEAGKQVFQQLIDDDPTDVWSYIFWGDVFAFPDSPKNKNFAPERARQIYTMGLDKTEGQPDRSEILDRIESLPKRH